MMCVAKPTGFLLALRGIPIPIPAPAPACARYVGGSVKCSRSVEMVCTTGARGGGYGECGAESGWCGAAAYLIRGAHARGGEWSRYHVNARASAVPVSAAGAPAPAGGLPLLQPRACAPGAQTRAAVRARRISPLAMSNHAARPRSVLDAMHHVLTRATSVASPLRHTRWMLRLRCCSADACRVSGWVEPALQAPGCDSAHVVKDEPGAPKDVSCLNAYWRR